MKPEHDRYSYLIEKLGRTLNDYNIAEIDEEKTEKMREERQTPARLVLLVMNIDVLRKSLFHKSKTARKHGRQSPICLDYDSSTKQAILTLNPNPGSINLNPLSDKSLQQIEAEYFLNYLSRCIKDYERRTGHRIR